MQPGPGAADSHELRALTGIRGVAALAVLLYHALPQWVALCPGLAWLALAAERGPLGVELFFILSGFILSYVYVGAGGGGFGWRDYLRFISLRVARIYPVHVATLLLLLGWSMLAPRLHVPIDADNYPLSGLAAQLTMTHAWPFLYGGRWNLPSWTISAEWFAYLAIFPLARVLLARRRPAGAWLLIGWLALGAQRVMDHLAWPDVVYEEHRLAIAGVSFAFMSGAAFFAIFRQGGKTVRWCQAGSTFLAAALLILLTMIPSPWVSDLAIFLMPPLLVGLTSDRTLVGRLLSSPPVLWLGRNSYSIYMSHAFVLQLWRAGHVETRLAGAPAAVRYLAVGASVLAVLAAGAAFCSLVEIPGRHLLRKLPRLMAKQPQA